MSHLHLAQKAKVWNLIYSLLMSLLDMVFGHGESYHLQNSLEMPGISEYVDSPKIFQNVTHLPSHFQYLLE
jgi:hypothetical protein